MKKLGVLLLLLLPLSAHALDLGGESSSSLSSSINVTDITSKTEVSPDYGDFFLATDASDSNNLKKIDAGKMLNNYFDVKDYGALGDNSTDDLAAIQAAFDAAGVSSGTVVFPDGKYKISGQLNLYDGIRVIGGYGLSGDDGGTWIIPTISTPIFVLQNTDNAGSEQQQVTIDGIHFSGGTNQVYAPNGGVWVTLRNCTFNGPSFAGIYLRGFIQEWFGRDLEFRGGQYGIYLTETGIGTDGVTSKTPILFDKTNWYSTYFTGQTKDAIHLDLGAQTGSTNSFVDLRIYGAYNNGAVFKGGFRGLSLVGFNTESNGYTGSAPESATTATTVVSSSYVVVGSTVGYTAGSTVTIKGAGSADGRTDWFPVIAAVYDSSMTMTTNASYAVSSQEMVPYLYSDLVIAASGGATPNGVFIANPVVGITSVFGAVRYALDFTNAYNVVVTNLVNTRRYYDPYGSVTLMGMNGSNYASITSGQPDPGAQVDIRSSPTAYPGYHPLRISDDDGTVNLLVEDDGDITTRENRLDVQIGNGRVGVGGVGTAGLNVTSKTTSDDTLKLNAINAQSGKLLNVLNAAGNSIFKIEDGGVTTIGLSTDTVNVNMALRGKTSTGANTATLTNSPVSGNPTGYLSINFNGTESYIPYWQ